MRLADDHPLRRIEREARELDQLMGEEDFATKQLHIQARVQTIKAIARAAIRAEQGGEQA